MAVREVEWRVPGDLPKTFRVDLTLHDESGAMLSANDYVLLRRDQDKARRQCAERAKRFQEAKKQFPAADYYRFFPRLAGEDLGVGVTGSTDSDD